MKHIILFVCILFITSCSSLVNNPLVKKWTNIGIDTLKINVITSSNVKGIYPAEIKAMTNTSQFVPVLKISARKNLLDSFYKLNIKIHNNVKESLSLSGDCSGGNWGLQIFHQEKQRFVWSYFPVDRDYTILPISCEGAIVNRKPKNPNPRTRFKFRFLEKGTYTLNFFSNSVNSYEGIDTYKLADSTKSKLLYFHYEVPSKINWLISNSINIVVE